MKKIHKLIPVLNAITPKNQSYEHGDFVQCVNCGKWMLVDIGTEECPECGECSLQWADFQEEAEIDGEQLEKSGYKLLDRAEYESAC